MTRKRHLTDTDQALWAHYASMVKPLQGRTPVAGLLAPSNLADPAGSAPVRPHVADQVSKPRKVASPLTVGLQPGGLDSATWKRFRTGKLGVPRKLDLHGMTTQRAFHALISFLRNAHTDQVRVVEIVTGRGTGEQGGAIRRELPHWLNRPDIRPLILGAVHPHPLNPGAVRLILRRLR